MDAISKSMPLLPVSRIVSRIIKKEDYDGNGSYWVGFICGKSSFSNKCSQSYYDNVFEVKDKSLEVVAFLTDIKLIEMNYKVKYLGIK